MADTASKGAVLAMTRELAMVHAREGIRFNALCPFVPVIHVKVVDSILMPLCISLQRTFVYP
jgi:NAD(P)-dependent dehydrogenase (short-subunit alcohol dehydrogenase family)